MPRFLYFRKPSDEDLARFLAAQRAQPFSYPDVGASRATLPTGYVVDHRRVYLGDGAAVFTAACLALRHWHMLPPAWVQVYCPTPALAPGTDVLVLAHCYGLWWLNACRIVYVLEDTVPQRRFGFAYGTLRGHAECGEERFTVEWQSDNTVWYDLLAFSRPGRWLVRLGYRWARRVQERFGQASLMAMVQAVATQGEEGRVSP